MGEFIPQRYASPDNALIVVGAVDVDGNPSRVNQKIGPAPNARGRDRQLTGEITVYALGESVDVPTPGTVDDRELGWGTSFATPQVAGLVAYVLALPRPPELQTVFTPRRIAAVMKFWIRNNKRGHNRDGWDIAYNSIRGDACDVQPLVTKRSLSRIIKYALRIFKRQSTASGINGVSSPYPRFIYIAVRMLF